MTNSCPNLRPACHLDGFHAAGVDFTPKTYADLIHNHDLHLERKFACPDGLPYRSTTHGLLEDRPIVAAHIKHVGKEGNELDEHDVGTSIGERESSGPSDPRTGSCDESDIANECSDHERPGWTLRVLPHASLLVC